MSRVLEKLARQGLLKPMEPKPLPNPLPSHYNLSLYCHFHQQKGHDTDNCVRLKHEIQDLIDSRKIPDPEKDQPNTHRNPLPNYHYVPPPTSMINSGLPENLILETFDHEASCMGIWDTYSEDEIELKRDFWEDFSSSDEEEVKGMTRSGRFYSDATEKEKGNEVLEEGREVAENGEKTEGGIVLQ